MMVNPANKGNNYLFAIPNNVGMPVNNFQMNQQVAIPVPNYTVNHTVGMPVVNFGPMFQNFQSPLPAQVELPFPIPIPSTPIIRMTVEEVATWINKFANSRKWEEADKYADSFRRNQIDGKQMVELKNTDLWTNLEIAKLGHRLEILKTIKDLCPLPRARCANLMERSTYMMERYKRTELIHHESDSTETSFDGTSAPESRSRSSRKLRRRFTRSGGDSSIAYYSDGDCPGEKTRYQNLSPKELGKAAGNIFQFDNEAQVTPSSRIIKAEAISGGVESNQHQQPMMDKTIINKDDHRETAPPFIDINKQPLDIDIRPMTRCRISEVVTPAVKAPSRSISPVSNSPCENDIKSQNKPGFNMEKSKNEGIVKKFRLPHHLEGL